MKKILGAALIFIVIVIPSTSAIQSLSNEHEDVIFALNSRAGKLTLGAFNYGNESVNYSLIIIYGNLRILLLKDVSPTMVFENGTIAPNGSFERTYRLRFSFSPIVALLQFDDQSLVRVGRIFGRRAIFRTTGVLGDTFSFY